MAQDPKGDTVYYASLIGPMRGAYYPLPQLHGHTIEARAEARRAALTTSKLRNLWANIFTEEDVDRQIKEYGEGFKLPHLMAARLDYDSYQVQCAGRGVAWSHEVAS